MQLNHLTLPDGRNLAYAQYGNLDGFPVIRCHGTPGSHLTRPDEIEAAAETGIRLIVPNRPGYGESTFQPDRTLLDWADDVAALADALDLEKFGIIGFSGGGPHALTCAYKLPDRITRVGLISALGPCVELGEQRTPMTLERREFKAAQLRDEPDSIDNMINSIPEPDRSQLRETRQHTIDTRLEATRNGAQGTVQDETLILCEAWGFSLTDIKVAVHIWYGEHDEAVPPEHAQYMADKIPNATLTRVADSGHLMPKSVLRDVFGIFISS